MPLAHRLGSCAGTPTIWRHKLSLTWLRSAGPHQDHSRWLSRQSLSSGGCPVSCGACPVSRLRQSVPVPSVGARSRQSGPVSRSSRLRCLSRQSRAVSRSPVTVPVPSVGPSRQSVPSVGRPGYGACPVSRCQLRCLSRQSGGRSSRLRCLSRQSGYGACPVSRVGLRCLSRQSCPVRLRCLSRQSCPVSRVPSVLCLSRQSSRLRCLSRQSPCVRLVVASSFPS